MHIISALEKKSNLIIEFGSFFKFFLSLTPFFCLIRPFFGYPRPNLKFSWTHINHANQFHNLVIHWAQSWPLFFNLEAFCEFSSLGGFFWPKSPFSSTLSEVRYYWVSLTGPNAWISWIIHLELQFPPVFEWSANFLDFWATQQEQLWKPGKRFDKF